MKSRLSGFKNRLREQQSSLKPKISSGAGLARIIVFWVVLFLFVAILFIPENPTSKFELYSKAKDNFSARVTFKFSPANGIIEVHDKGDVIISRGTTVDEYLHSLIIAESKEYDTQHDKLEVKLPLLSSIILLVLASLSAFIIFGREFLEIKNLSPLKLLYLGWMGSTQIEGFQRGLPPLVGCRPSSPYVRQSEAQAGH